jgi:hypothetical protein
MKSQFPEYAAQGLRQEREPVQAKDRGGLRNLSGPRLPIAGKSGGTRVALAIGGMLTANSGTAAAQHAVQGALEQQPWS